MSGLDWILVAIRWGHALAAVAWVGGGAFYLLVLRPALRRAPASAETSRAIGQEFRGLVTTAIAVLLVTGIVLSVSRLTAEAATIPYMAVLALKVALALYLFYTVWYLRGARAARGDAARAGWWGRVRSSLTGTTAVLVIGVIIIGLSDVLDALFEGGLGG